MEPDKAACAFDRSYRAAERPNGAPGHSGSAPGVDRERGSPCRRYRRKRLGLAIVAAIAQAHGGYATLRSDREHGTRVRVWLPAGTIAPSPAPVRADPAGPPVTATAAFRRRPG
jgi:hypothetical protein